MRKSIPIQIFVLLVVFFVLASVSVSGQHPLKKDTDDDGIPDDWENEHWLDPYNASDASLDYNYNGLTNFQEYKNDYDPWDIDTDDDGISNYAECWGLFCFFTDHFASDTDADGLSDLEEICMYIDTGDETRMKEIYPDKTDRGGVRVDINRLHAKYHNALDPTNPDVDGDGLSDGDEISAGTNPNCVDSDLDGLSDGDEVHEYKTDPRKRDTDGDWLLDCEEVFGTYGIVTDPTNADSDGDGISDGEEILGFGFIPIEPSEHTLTYEEFISSNAYTGEYITLKAKVEKIRYHPDKNSYLLFLEPLELGDGAEGKRGVVRVDSPLRYDFGEMMHVDSRFEFSLREGDTIVIVGKAGKFLGGTREIRVDSGGKIYLVLSPEEARERWLPKKDYVKILSERKETSETVTPSPMPSPAPSPTFTSTPTSTPLPSPANETNATTAGELGAEGSGGIFGLLGYVAIGIVIVIASLFLYTKFGKGRQILKVRKEGKGGKPSAEVSGMRKGTRKEWS